MSWECMIAVVCQLSLNLGRNVLEMSWNFMIAEVYEAHEMSMVNPLV